MAKVSEGFDDRILKARMKLGMTQAQFAKHMGVGRVTVSKWENGHRGAHWTHMEKLLESAEKDTVTIAAADYHKQVRAACEQIYKIVKNRGLISRRELWMVMDHHLGRLEDGRPTVG